MMSLAIGVRLAEGMRSIRAAMKTERPSRLRDRLAAPGRPRSFVSCPDPGGRDVFEYPSEWRRQDHHGGILGVSTRIASFGRVDILPGDADVERSLSQELGQCDIVLRRAGPPEHIKANVQIDRIQFALDVWVWAVGREKAALSTGYVVDRKRSRAIEQYEDRIHRLL